MFRKKNIIITLAILVSLSPFVTNAITPLRVSQIRVELSNDTATIKWYTNKAASSSVRYGETKLYGMFITTNLPQREHHELTLRDLLPDTLYHFQVHSTDALGQVAISNDFTFKTEKFEDDATPIISNVSKPYITGTSVTVTWQTDIKTSGRVHYGPDMNYGRSVSARSYEDGTKHEVTIRRLQPQSLYHFRVESKTRRGKPARYQDVTFKTTSFINPEKESLIISHIEPADTQSVFIAPTSATISWRTSKPSRGHIRYGREGRLRTRIDETGVSTFHHSIHLTDLEPGIEYSYTIHARGVFGKSITTKIHSFNTTLVPFNTPIVLSARTQKQEFPSINVVAVNSENKIFGILNGHTHHLRTPIILASYGRSFSDVVHISNNELSSYPIASLVKTKESPVVYFYDEKRNLKKRIPSESVFLSYPQNTWGNIVTVTAEDLLYMKESNLIKTAGDSAVYHVNFVTNEKKVFTTEKAFLSRGYSFDDIITVNTSELNSYRNASNLE